MDISLASRDPLLNGQRPLAAEQGDHLLLYNLKFDALLYKVTFWKLLSQISFSLIIHTRTHMHPYSCFIFIFTSSCYRLNVFFCWWGIFLVKPLTLLK